MHYQGYLGSEIENVPKSVRDVLDLLEDVVEYLYFNLLLGRTRRLRSFKINVENNIKILVIYILN